MQNKQKVLAVVGPTASGKTALGVELAKAYGGEVISADSMQIYEGLDIGSAKPAEEEMQGIPHHLIGFLPRTEKFSVADYVTLCHEKIAEISSRGRLPIIVGGTGLYVDSVLSGMAFAQEEKASPVREALTSRLHAEGAEALYAELKALDPEAAEKIHPNNTVRLIRALEVCRTSGVSFTEYKRRNAAHPRPYDDFLLGLDWPREVLYDRINRRVDAMVRSGLLDEVREARRHPMQTAAAAIGYKELLPYLDGEASLAQCLDVLRQETRRYAKRQCTWFRRNAEIHWLKLCETDEIREILEMAKKSIAKSDFL